MGISNLKELSREQLVEAIVKNPLLEWHMQNWLHVMDEKQWSFFCKAAAVKSLNTSVFRLNEFLPAQNLGMLQCFYHEEKLWYVIPKEVRTIFRRLVRRGLGVMKERDFLLTSYINASVNLYGVIEIEQLVALINDQIEDKTDFDEITDVVNFYDGFQSDYCSWEGNVVHFLFEEDGFKGVEPLLRARSGKHIYVPAPGELLKYADPDYYEWTPQTEALLEGLSGFVNDPIVARDIVDEIHDACMEEPRTQRYFDVFNDAGIEFNDIDQANRLMQLVMDVHNNTRLWSNYGNTPNELSRLRRPFLKPLSSRPFETLEAIGKNEPCPCGSGKKYKHCCGKPH
jgi:hypothetical protein